MSIAHVKAFARRVFPSVFDARDARAKEERLRRIERVLANPAPPQFRDDADRFESLQAAYGAHPEYGYDRFSMWSRGVDRARHLLSLGDLRDARRDVLEVACGDGMAGLSLAGYGHDVQLTDREDWRDARAGNLPLEISDISVRLPFPADRFDLVYSYNAFEHFPDPERALSEIARVCRPGGWMHFEFGPLYCSPWGLHAYRTLRMPYPQFLFPAVFVERKLHELGIRDLGRELEDLQFMNKWRPERFRVLWRQSRCEIVVEREHRDTAHLDLILRQPECFRGRGLALDDVTVHMIVVTLRKPAASGPAAPRTSYP